MTFPVTQLKNRDAQGVTFSAPSSPSLTVRFKTNVSGKVLSGHAVPNYLHEVIMNNLVPITVGSDSVNDPVSVRLRISGTLQSRTAISELLTELAARIATWDSENVYIGFEPSTAPGQI